MSGANITNLVIGIAVLVLFVSRQLATRRLRESYRLLIVLAAIGVVQFATFLNGHPHHGGAIVADRRAVGGGVRRARSCARPAAPWCGPGAAGSLTWCRRYARGLRSAVSSACGCPTRHTASAAARTVSPARPPRWTRTP
jgi:hypothetical protein